MTPVPAPGTEVSAALGHDKAEELWGGGVVDGEDAVTITQDEVPVAVVVSAEAYQQLLKASR